MDVLWNASRRAMITEHKKIAVELYVYSAGGALSARGLKGLKENIAALQRREGKGLVMRRYGKASGG